MGCAVLGGPVALAQADNNSIRATMNQYGPTIIKDENAVNRGEHLYTKGKWKPLVRAFNHEVADLRALKSQLAHQSASTKKGARAKKDIVRGLGGIITAYARLSHLARAAKGRPLPSSANAVIQNGLKARATYLRGLNLLKHAH